MNLLQNLLPAAFGSGSALPDFIVVGSRGAGMTWLHHQLSRHPQIWLPPIGKPHFVTHEKQPEIRDSIVLVNGRRLKLSAEQYQRFMNGPKRGYRTRCLEMLNALPVHVSKCQKTFSSRAGGRMFKGDINTTYLRLSEKGIREIKSRISGVGIVMVLQNPLENVLESIRRSAGESEQPLSAMDWQRLADRIVFYMDNACSEILPLWEKVFGDEIIYLPFHRIHRNEDQQLGQLLKRLDPGLEITAAEPIPRTKEDEIEIPAPILKLVTERTRKQVDFLQKRFPS